MWNFFIFLSHSVFLPKILCDKVGLVISHKLSNKKKFNNKVVSKRFKYRDIDHVKGVVTPTKFMRFVVSNSIDNCDFLTADTLSSLCLCEKNEPLGNKRLFPVFAAIQFFQKGCFCGYLCSDVGTNEIKRVTSEMFDINQFNAFLYVLLYNKIPNRFVSSVADSVFSECEKNFWKIPFLSSNNMCDYGDFEKDINFLYFLSACQRLCVENSKKAKRMYRKFKAKMLWRMISPFNKKLTKYEFDNLKIVFEVLCQHDNSVFFKIGKKCLRFAVVD